MRLEETKLFKKLAGGPGSRVSSDNTKMITKEFRGIALSPVMSIMYRKKFMEWNKPVYENKKILVSRIKYVSQEKFIPSKLQKFVNKPELLEIPVDVLVDYKGDIHMMDGHHRFLAALKQNKRYLYANIYRVPKKTNK